MSPRPEAHEPGEQPRRPSGEWPAPPALVQPPEKSFWNAEGIFAAVGCALTVGGLIVGLIVHATLLSYRVDALEKSTSATEATHGAYERRMSTIEATAASNKADADKRESLLEQSLRDISAKIDGLITSVDKLHK